MSFSAFQAEAVLIQTPLRRAISLAHRRSEPEAVAWLLTQAADHPDWQQDTQTLARRLVEKVRGERSRASGVDALMHEFSLSSQEGIALMCLAEALLRIPDRQTADRLIADKIGKGDWARHLGESPSLFVNAATWGLLITGKLVATNSEHGLGAALSRLIAKGGEPLIRKGVDLAMRMLGEQFVTGQTIAEALANSRTPEQHGYRHSYDMLGEAALTSEDAQRYFAAYEEALHAIGHAAAGRGIKNGPGISVKLSALHPRYSRAQRARVLQELLPRLKALALLAKRYDIGLNIDAEESERLELSLDLIEALAIDPHMAGFHGIGVVVQAYQKRAPFVIDYLADLARRTDRKLMVRLVKGAYWDAEIKRSQVEGLSDYPVYTRKVHTDLSYLVCAQKLLALGDLVYPQFATHNAHTLAAIYTWAARHGVGDYEFQCLHGMGETLYDQVVGDKHLGKPCRIYAPVGSHKTLLAYLVRRLLENGANSSFVNQLLDEKTGIDALLADPIAESRKLGGIPHPRIPLPEDLFGSVRRNSSGIDFSNDLALSELATAIACFGKRTWHARPLIAGDFAVTDTSQAINNPADHHDIVGRVLQADAVICEIALTEAAAHAMDWQTVTTDERASLLCKAADLLEQHHIELMALLIREAGKTLPNAAGEVREAIDFLRYYAQQARDEHVSLAWGQIVCISPWNFPLAIFIGQLSAALATGNVVLAKPAEQTPLIAYRAVQLLHEAGIPRHALQLLPGRGETVGAKLVSDARVRGVVFTGSTEVAQLINRTLAKRMVHESCEIPLIAETGGQNAMIVDSSALPEQVVQDVLSSAFDSAGQRCSALRVLLLQEEIADHVLAMLKGAMHELCLDRPDRLTTDIGPVIDSDARQNLQQHIDRIKPQGRQLFQLPLSVAHECGTFLSPTMLEIGSLSELTREVFGPVLHVLRYRGEQLPNLLQDINALGYGLTLGVHSRIDETIAFVTTNAHTGNIYVNRNIIGAVVGVQPFGGEGKSGTGPKAGGPLYLKRLQRQAALHIKGHEKSSSRLPALMDFLGWSKEQGRTDLSGLIDRYREETLLGHMLTCPGPTGESNTLSFAPRGTIACIAEEENILLNQLAATLATGNRALVNLRWTNVITNLPSSVQHQIDQEEKPETTASLLALALVEGACLQTMLPAFAAREGALVPVITVNPKETIPLWRLMAERAICINTTAAGGNASLMTLEE